MPGVICRINIISTTSHNSPPPERQRRQRPRVERPRFDGRDGGRASQYEAVLGRDLPRAQHIALDGPPRRCQAPRARRIDRLVESDVRRRCGVVRYFRSVATRHERERRRPLEGDVNHDIGQAAAGVQARHERITRGFDIARVADDYALCMDSTRACLHYLKARQLPVDRLFDQLGKALVLTQRLSLSMTRS